MKKYHILFKENIDDFHSRGEDFEDFSALDAIGAFQEKYPNYVLLALFTEEMMKLKNY